jgi:eukaryotic-like serine/threonine-protein kinase
MLTNDGRVKVLDFGLAKLRDEPQFGGEQTVGPTRALTGEGRILGTVAYMSPEQAEGKPVDQRSDVFSLGVMLYEMASGERPFTGDTAMSILTSIMRDTPRSIAELKRDVPADFARIVRRCLAKDPEDRYQTAKDLRNDLRGLREDLNSGERASVASSSSSAGMARPVSSAAAAPAKSSGRRWLIAGAALIVILAAAFAAWRYGGSREIPAVTQKIDPFTSIVLTRLTTTGTAGLAALSQDARYVAHVITDDRGSSIWLRQVATSSNVQIVPPEDGRMAGIAFSPSGDYVNYVLYPKGENYASLRQVPVLGGGVRKLADDIDTAPTFSPDGKRLAFFRGLPNQGSLMMVANVDGGDLHQLAVRNLPRGFQLNLQTLSWSPDGKMIAAAGFDNSKLAGEIVIVDAASGEEHVLPSGQWRAITALAWTPDGRGLLLTAQEAGGESIGQVWFVPYPTGPVRKITNDLSTYSGMTVSADGRSLVTVRAEQRAAVWLVTVDGSDARPLPGAGADDGVQGIAFAPDGRIVYTSTSAGNSDIWIMNADGSNRVQLTSSKSDDVLPAVTADGRFIIFVSEREGKRALWRMDTSGSSQTRLSDETVNRSNFGPGITADSRWVFFTNDKGINLKVDVDGHSLGPVFAAGSGDGQTQKATAVHDVLPMPDGTTLTGHYIDPTARAERLAVVPIADPAAARLLPAVRNNGLSWDGRSLIYWDTTRGVGNVWRQAISGGNPVQLTHFDSSVVFRHALAPDQKHIALVRGSTISDVILLTDRPTTTSR